MRFWREAVLALEIVVDIVDFDLVLGHIVNLGRADRIVSHWFYWDDYRLVLQTSKVK
jgi:hypothetical protein